MLQLLVCVHRVVKIYLKMLKTCSGVMRLREKCVFRKKNLLRKILIEENVYTECVYARMLLKVPFALILLKLLILFSNQENNLIVLDETLFLIITNNSYLINKTTVSLSIWHDTFCTDSNKTLSTGNHRDHVKQIIIYTYFTSVIYFIILEWRLFHMSAQIIAYEHLVSYNRTTFIHTIPF